MTSEEKVEKIKLLIEEINELSKELTEEELEQVAGGRCEFAFGCDSPLRDLPLSDDKENPFLNHDDEPPALTPTPPPKVSAPLPPPSPAIPTFKELSGRK
ncbi:MAG: hypothetical protein LBL23_05280 [Coriobacteriales bacterium]|nr:hypothetical protein [Coriobacteriales bacterium]